MIADWMDRPVTIEVTGSDGSEWTICGPDLDSPAELDVKPSADLYYAPVKTRWQESNYGEGAIYQGFRYLPRDVVFAVHLFDDPAAGRSWHEVESAWARAWRPDRDSFIHISSDSGTRSLAVRLREAIQLTPEHDPHLGRYVQATMTVRAGHPFWTTPAEMDVIQASGGTGQYKVSVSNPADTPMWLRWVTEPGATFGLPDWDFAGGTRMVRLPDAYRDKPVAIDTHPLRETITIPGWDNAWEAMGGVDFLFPVPPGTPDTDLTVWWTAESGGPHVAVFQDRNYTRPWG